MNAQNAEAADFITPFTVDGLHGRVLHLPAKSKQGLEMLFIAGQHSSLERWWGLVQAFNDFTGVTMPDLPGFGGMDSLYTIGKTASVDDLADTLAVFIKERYKDDQKIVIAGMSLAFVVVTRMLQRHPELVKHVDMLISIVGMAHHDDFIFSKTRYRLYRGASWFFSGRLASAFFRNVFLRPGYLRRVYAHSFNAREKFKDLAGDEFSRTMAMELHLWKINDIRTQMKTNHEMLTLNNCTKTVPLPVWHVAAPKDRYFDNARVEAHMRQIFNDFHLVFTEESNHAPTVIADAKAAAPFIPKELRDVLRKRGQTSPAHKKLKS